MLQAIKLFQETVSNLTGLEFNKDYSLAMVSTHLNPFQRLIQLDM